jgi:hypothetical protein
MFAIAVTLAFVFDAFFRTITPDPTVGYVLTDRYQLLPISASVARLLPCFGAVERPGQCSILRP